MTLTDVVISVLYGTSIAVLGFVIFSQMTRISELREHVDHLERRRADQATRASKAESRLGRELAAGGAFIREIQSAIAKFNESQVEEEDE